MGKALTLYVTNPGSIPVPHMVPRALAGGIPECRARTNLITAECGITSVAFISIKMSANLFAQNISRTKLSSPQ